MATLIRVGGKFVNVDNITRTNRAIYNQDELIVHFNNSVSYDEVHISTDTESFYGEDADALEAYLNNNSVNVLRLYQNNR